MRETTILDDRYYPDDGEALPRIDHELADSVITDVVHGMCVHGEENTNHESIFRKDEQYESD